MNTDKYFIFINEKLGLFKLILIFLVFNFVHHGFKLYFLFSSIAFCYYFSGAHSSNLQQKKYEH